MKIKSVLYLCIFVIILIFILYRFVVNTGENNNDINKKVQTSLQKQTTLLKQTSEGTVTVAATPKALTKGARAVFEIQFNTHSVELDYDIAKIAFITDDVGNTLKPISWTGEKGGHHLSGILTFPPISQDAKSIILSIPQIDNSDRVFTWNL